MNTKLEKLEKHINGLIAAKTSEAAKVQAEKTEVKERLTNYKAAIETTEDPKEYEDLMKSVTYTEGLLKVYDNKLNNLNRCMDEDSYKSIASELLEVFEKSKEDYTEKINNELIKLITIADEYRFKVELIADLQQKAANLAGKRPGSYPIARPEELVSIREPGDWFSSFMQYYILQTNKRNALVRYGITK